ncbi:MAG TPA: hypothetical protein VHY35_03825 [Stellaceae bacterium]|jgi:hypothetical protein|nr:hypothetical protein [Stellaceae bacterium]
MDIVHWLLTPGILIVLAFAGVLRPTGLAGRTGAERRQDAWREAVAKWLNKGE